MEQPNADINRDISKWPCINFIKVAREALVIDGDLDDVEENVMRELCSIFEINEDEIS